MDPLTREARTGGEMVCRAMAGLGTNAVFSVSGNQILPIYDAAPDAGLRIVHMRHESAAAYAATAWAELTGKIGAVLTSAGPGFVAALQGVGVCRSMELPLLFMSGQSATTDLGHGAFQELDQARIAGAICKASLAPERVEDIPGAIAEAARLATAGVPGPVHVSLPGDLLAASGTAPEDAPESMPAELTERQRATLEEMAARLATAKRPLILARPAAMRGRARTALDSIAIALEIEPVVIEAPRSLADLRYADIIRHMPDCDCALVVAPDDFAIGFLAPERLASDGAILLIDAPGDPPPEREIDLHVQADPAAVLEALAASVKPSGAVDPSWSALWPVSTPPEPEPVPEGEVHPLAITAGVRQRIGPDDVILLDGGEFCQWVRLGLRGLPNPVLWNSKFGAIGGAIPMAVGAAVALEGTGRRAIAIMGDGGAGYHLSEFETLARYGLAIVAIIGNDARWAAEWHLQVRRYGRERTFETELLQARYDLVAAGFESYGERVTSDEELEGALQEAFGRRGASCINVHIAPLPSPAAMA